MTKQKFLQFAALFMLIIFTFSSCIKDNLPALISSSKLNTIEDRLVEVMTYTGNYVSKHPRDLEGAFNVSNKYLKDNYGTEANISFKDLESLIKKFQFASDDNSMKQYFIMLEKDKKLSRNEMEQLIILDEKVIKTVDFEAQKKIVSDFAESLTSNTNLSINEKNRMLAFSHIVNGQLTYMKTQYENSSINKANARSSVNCQDCIGNHSWDIAVIGAILGIFICIFDFEHCLQDILASYFFVVLIFCPCCDGAGSNCSGPPVCNVCPSGYTYDGANCYSGYSVPIGSANGFVYGNAFYYTPIQSRTGSGTTFSCLANYGWYDGANCLVNYFDTNYTPFIWNRTFYLQPHCQ